MIKKTISKPFQNQNKFVNAIGYSAGLKSDDPRYQVTKLPDEDLKKKKQVEPEVKMVYESRLQEGKGAPKIISSTSQAKDHYDNGDGSAVQLDRKTSQMAVDSPEFQRVKNRLVSGIATHITSDFDIDLTSKIFHVGRTNVNYKTTCNGKTCTTKFTLFVDDGFWDPNVFAEKTMGHFSDDYKPDGKGPNLETKEGSPYDYIPVVIIMTYPDPETYSKKK